MADRMFSGTLKTVGGRVKVVHFFAYVAPAVNPVICNSQAVAKENRLVSSTAVRNSAGNYTFTLRDKYLNCIAAHATYTSFVENEDLYAQTASVVVGSATNTVTVRLKAGAVNTDPSVSGMICVTLTYEDSGAYS
jgi:hypothetical protein